MASSRSKLIAWGYVGLLILLQILVARPLIGSATYLADQLDQTGAFLELLQGKWQFLYGPFMSDTNPPVHCFGPLGSLLFGFPTLLGANPDQLHALFIGLVSLASPVLFFELHKQKQDLAYIWSAMLLALPNFWWYHSLLWVNVLLLPLICLEISLFFRLFRRATWPTWIGLVAVFVLGLHIHSSAIFGAGLVLVGLFPLLNRSDHQPSSRLAWISSGLLLSLAVLPYTIAELISRGQNTRAIVKNLLHFGAKPDHSEGLLAVTSSTSQILSVFGWTTPERFSEVLTLLVLGFATVAALLLLRHALKNRFKISPSTGLGLVWGMTFLEQAAFFYVMNRQLLSIHYTTFLIPFYVLPWAGLIVFSLQRLPIKTAISPALAIVLAFAAFLYFPKTFESGSWNFQTIKSSLESACIEFGEIDTIEPVPFRAYDDEIDSLLKFIGHRYVRECRFSDQSPVRLMPSMPFQGKPATIKVGSKDYALIKVLPPWIGVYRESSQQF